MHSTTQNQKNHRHMITIYHNPRCSKSRECETFLGASGKDVRVINYMQTPFTKEELTKVISLLDIKPIELVRKNETIWKELFKDRKMTDSQVINALLKHPKLIQRPIVVSGDKAIIARPLELLDSIL